MNVPGGPPRTGDRATEPAPPNVLVARRVLIGMTVGYVLYLAWSVAVLLIPRRVDGVRDSSGLDGIPLGLGILALPLYLAIAGTIWAYVLKPDRRGSGSV